MKFVDRIFGQAVWCCIAVFVSACCTDSVPRPCRAFDCEKKIGLPVRPACAPTGKLFIKSVDTAGLKWREERIVQEILSGNVPDFLRTFRRFTYDMVLEGGESGPEEKSLHTVEFYALPDYLAIGSDEDFIRMPMTPLAAQRIADSLFCSLPTALLVDKIAEASQGAIDPFPFRPVGSRNEQPAVFEDSDNVIKALYKAKGYLPGQLISGLKKDVIISRLITDSTRPNHMVIYGWHYPDGSRIQPSTNIHVNYYVDYSHGIRLIYRMIVIDGREYDIQKVLEDPRLFRLVSDEDGPMEKPTYAEE